MATTTSSANTLGTAQANSPVTSAVKSQEAPPSLPWWRYGMVWMVIAGPAIVVVAGFITLWIAISRPDPVVDDDYYQRGLNINETLRQSDRSMLPAVKGRNHAATDDKDVVTPR